MAVRTLGQSPFKANIKVLRRKVLIMYEEIKGETN